jgi:hypothetical protein
MNILLIFFAIPLATIILSAILETFIRCPYKTGGIFFSIFLVTAFALGGSTELLVATIIYTIISFITAYIIMIIGNRNNDNISSNNISNNNISNNNIEYGYNSLDTGYLSNNENTLNPLQESDIVSTNNNLLNNNFNPSSCRRYR